MVYFHLVPENIKNVLQDHRYDFRVYIVFMGVKLGTLPKGKKNY